MSRIVGGGRAASNKQIFAPLLTSRSQVFPVCASPARTPDLLPVGTIEPPEVTQVAASDGLLSGAAVHLEDLLDSDDGRGGLHLHGRQREHASDRHLRT